MRATYRMLTTEVGNGGSIWAKQLRQFVEGGRRLRLGKYTAMQARKRIFRLRQETSCLATDTLQGNQNTLQVFEMSLAATARRSAQIPWVETDMRDLAQEKHNIKTTREGCNVGEPDKELVTAPS